MEHNCPDATVVEQAAQEWILDEEITNYCTLLRKSDRGSTKIVLLVVGCLGAVSGKLKGFF